MRPTILVALGCLLVETSTRLAMAADPLSPLKVSADGHGVDRADGKPFFWLADTAWFALSRLSSAEMEQYFAVRERQGFSVIQVMALPRSSRGPADSRFRNAISLDQAGRLIPDLKWFEALDRFLDLAEQHGLYVVIFPASKGFVRPPENSPDREMPVNTKNARLYGRFLGERYGRRAGVLWSVGGDYLPSNDAESTIVEDLAAGLKEGGAAQLMAYHPKGTNSSSDFFHDRAWLDVNMCQSAHSLDFPISDLITRGYRRTPAKPIIDGESLYENIPVPLWRSTPQTPLSTAYEVRRPIYAGLFAGGFGVTYGANGVYQFHVPSPDGGARGRPLPHWKDALNYPAARQMVHLRNLIESRPGIRVPDQSLIVSNAFTQQDRIMAMRSSSGDWAIFYSAGGKSWTVDCEKLNGAKLRETWFDPRTGQTSHGGEFDRTGIRSFEPPVQPERQDWILILDNADRDFPIPGAQAGAPSLAP